MWISLRKVYWFGISGKVRSRLHPRSDVKVCEGFVMRISDSCRKYVLGCIVGLFLACRVGAAMASGAMPAEGNAALLYYQACIKIGLLKYQADLDPNVLDVSALGREPNSSVKELVKEEQFRQAMELLRSAATMQECDWGFMPSQTWGKAWIGNSLWGDLGRSAVAEVWVLAADGKYTSALETAMALRRLATNMGDDDYSMWNMSVEVDLEAMSAIQCVLERMPLDKKSLTWLEERMADSEGAIWRPRTALKKWGIVASCCVDPDYFQYWKDTWVAEIAEIQGSARRTKLRELTVSEALRRAHESYENFIDLVIGVLAVEGGYKVKRAKLEELTNHVGDDNPILLLNDRLPIAVNPILFYDRHIERMARVYAIRAAIRIYQIKAQKGYLPEVLPEVYWLDPYSGKDFVYKKLSDDHFLLRCALAAGFRMGREHREFHFRVAQEGGEKSD